MNSCPNQMQRRVCLMVVYAAVMTAVVSSYAPNSLLTFAPRANTRRTTNYNNNRQQESRLIKNTQRSTLFMSASAAMPDGPSDWENEGRVQKQQQQQQQQDKDKATNFLPLHSPQRLSRIEQEAKAKSKFLHGDDLVELRKYMNNLELDLKVAREDQDGGRIKDLSQALHDSRNLDAEVSMKQIYLSFFNLLISSLNFLPHFPFPHRFKFVYLNGIEMAEAADSEEEAKEWKKVALEARECLPQFNLQGLWVGK